MTQPEQIDAFKGELEFLVERWRNEFDLEPETILGAMRCVESLMLADLTMCYVGRLAEEDAENIERIDDDDDDDEGDEWRIADED